jgi:soluble lytic murein transglycosylase-like protein
MSTSYRILAIVSLFVASSAMAAGRFNAADVPAGLGIKKRAASSSATTIENSITAYSFFGNVSKALVSLRTSKSLRYASFGNSVYDSSAQVNTALPVYLTEAISDAAKTHGVDPRLIVAVARRESKFNPKAVSPVGACGVMQLIPATARYLGIKDIFNARENVFAGAKYLRTLLDTFHGDLDLTLAAYNAGPGAVQKYNGVPPFRGARVRLFTTPRISARWIERQKADGRRQKVMDDAFLLLPSAFYLLPFSFPPLQLVAQHVEAILFGDCTSITVCFDLQPDGRSFR